MTERISEEAPVSPPRVLFVDDEPRILDGLRRSLRGKRRDWEMSFVNSGAAALELIAQTPPDVVVSDMRMPGMNGAELLTHVSQSHPGVARVVLSGHTEPESAIKVAIAGHRFLTKPADTEHVIAVITELTVRRPGGYGLRARRLAGAVRTLPSPAGHLDTLTGLLRGPDAELSGVMDAMSHNVGLAAKLLQLSGSPFFTSRTRIASFESVINAVGLPTIHTLVDTGQLLWASPAADRDTERYLEQSLRHAVATAYLVGSLASPGNRAYAQAAALLQDVGRFVCLAGADGAIDLRGPGLDGVPYREIGVELLRLWGLPLPVVAAVAHRDTEQQPTSWGLGVAAALRTAHLLLQHTDADDPADGVHDGDPDWDPGWDPDAELDALLSHPQLAAAGGQWPAAAREAADLAGRWPHYAHRPLQPSPKGGPSWLGF